MKRSTIQCILAGCLIASEPAASADAPKPTLMVRVYNDCHVPGETISMAFLRARRIFFDAGIETTWKIAERGRPYPASALGVQIIKGPSKASQMNEALGAASIGKNDEPEFLIKVFFGSIEEKTTLRLDAHTLLAYVMAHEIGHMLLGKEHTPETVMAALWTKAEYGLMSKELLRFSKSQANQLQTAVALRMNLQSGVKPQGRPSASDRPQEIRSTPDRRR